MSLIQYHYKCFHVFQQLTVYLFGMIRQIYFGNLAFMVTLFQAIRLIFRSYNGKHV